MGCKLIVRHKANSWMEMAGSGPAETLLSSFACCAHTHKYTHMRKHTHTHTALRMLICSRFIFQHELECLVWPTGLAEPGQPCSFPPHAVGTWPRSKAAGTHRHETLGEDTRLLSRVTSRERKHRVIQTTRDSHGVKLLLSKKRKLKPNMHSKPRTGPRPEFAFPGRAR